ncbi:MAG: hypothetical protein RR512_08435 [Coprobacillus sp.]
MNEFYEDVISSIMHKWVLGHVGIEKCCKNCSLYIESDEVYGVIHFHENNIVELTIKDNDSDENIFYLHFQMHDLNSSIKQFNTFFQYLSKPVIEHNDIDINDTSIKKILLSCSGGLTTSYFAYSIQEIMNQKNLGIQVDAVAYTDIDNVANEYDIILLAPQISYMLPTYKEKYGCKVMGIELIDFATSNFEGIVDKAFH